MNLNSGMNVSNPVSSKPFNLLTREELRHLNWDLNMSDADIATMYGVSSVQVHERRKKMNLVHGQITSEQMSDIVRMAEFIKELPLEAIEEIRSIVDRYRH